MPDLEGEEKLFVVTTYEDQKLNESPSVSEIKPVSSDVVAYEGLEDSLSRDREATLRLIEEAPLRLVALALVEVRDRTLKVADIRVALTQEVIEADGWEKWWKVVRFGIKESRHFDYPTNGPIRLRIRNLENIDSSSLDELRTAERKAQTASSKVRESSVPTPSIAGLGGWILWVQSDQDEPMPKSVPTADFVKFLRKLPGSVTQTAVSRLRSGITQRLIEAKQRPAENSIEMWQAALVSTLTRWSELSDPPQISVEDVVALTTRVLEKLGPDEFENAVAWLAGYTSESVENIESVSRALLSAYTESQEGTERLLAVMDGKLESRIRIALWNRLLRLELTQPSGVPMGRVARALSQDDKPELFISLLTEAHDQSSIIQVGNLLYEEWRLSDISQRHQLFDAVALAWVLHRRSLPDARATILEVLSDIYANSESEGSLMSEWREFAFSSSENEVMRIQEDKARYVGDLEERLRETEGELSLVRKQLKFLQSENRTKRRKAELEISRDAIKVLGIALQGIAGHARPQPKEIADLEANITLALSTLNAKPVGDIGQVLPFDPYLHEADSPQPSTGTSVTVIAPGVTYSRREDTPINLVKIKVQEREIL